MHLRTNRYTWHDHFGHTHSYSDTDSGGSTCGMAAMPKHWSDPGHTPSLKWNASCNCVYFVCLGEAHHCESHHTERINSLCRDAASSQLMLDLVHERLNFSTLMSWETLEFVCLTAGTLIAKDLINKSQYCDCKREKSVLNFHLSSSGLIEMKYNGSVSSATVFILHIIWVVMSLLEIK